MPVGVPGRAGRPGALLDLEGDAELFEGAAELRDVVAVDALRVVECGTDRDAIRERTIDLNKATEPLAEAMMDAAIRGAITSKRADQILEQK